MTDLEKRLYSGEQLFTAFELQELCYEFGDMEQNGSGRWQSHMTTVINVEDKYFKIEWEQGLTEYQEDSFDNQPYEVEPYEEKVIITKYKVKNK